MPLPMTIEFQGDRIRLQRDQWKNNDAYISNGRSATRYEKDGKIRLDIPITRKRGRAEKSHGDHQTLSANA